jgi:hypothetical protein
VGRISADPLFPSFDTVTRDSFRSTVQASFSPFPRMCPLSAVTYVRPQRTGALALTATDT